MRNLFFFGILICLFSCSQNDYEQRITNERVAKDRQFRDERTSPLKAKDRIGFRGLKYYPVRSKFRVIAELKTYPSPDTVYLQYTNGDPIAYVIPAKAEFEIDNKNLSLDIYEFAEKMKGDKPVIFFYDQTNGDVTYDGGRYLNIDTLAGNKVELDFNMAYNPYCVYNPKYNCPLPPFQNALDIRLEAGEKNYVVRK